MGLARVPAEAVSGRQPRSARAMHFQRQSAVQSSPGLWLALRGAGPSTHHPSVSGCPETRFKGLLAFSHKAAGPSGPQRSTTEQGSPWWRLTRALLRRGFHVRRLESPSGGGLLDGAPVDFVFVDSALACSASQPGPNEASRDVSGTSDVSGGGSGSGSASAGSSSAIVQCSDLLRSDTCTQQRTGQEGSGASSGDVWWSCGGSSRDPPQDGARSGNSASFRRTPGPASRVQQRRIQAPQDEIRACRSHRTNSGRTGSAMPPENAPQGAVEESAGAHAPRDGAPAVLVLSEVTHGERCRLEGLVGSVKWTMRGPGDWDALHHILADAHEGPAR